MNRNLLFVMNRNLLFVSFFFFLLNLTKAQYQIPSTFWGMNHWMPYEYIILPSGQTAPYPNGRVDCSPVQGLVKSAGIQFFRIGGNGYDAYGTAAGNNSTNNDYIKAMKLIRDSM